MALGYRSPPNQSWLAKKRGAERAGHQAEGELPVNVSGRRAYRGAIGIRGATIVAVGDVHEPAHRVIDASDLVVSPSFIDLHTHYEGQLFWNGHTSPSPLHGVTAVIGGNRGFSAAPPDSRGGAVPAGDDDRVEGIRSRI